MDSLEAREKIIEMICKAAEIEKVGVGSADSTLSQLGIDSLQLVSLVATLEDELNITIFFDDIQSNTTLLQFADRVAQAMDQ